MHAEFQLVKSDLKTKASLQNLVEQRTSTMLQFEFVKRKHEEYEQIHEDIKITLNALDMNLCLKVNNHHLKEVQIDIEKRFMTKTNFEALMDKLEEEAIERE